MMPAAMICPNSVKRSSSVMMSMGCELLPAEMSYMSGEPDGWQGDQANSLPDHVRQNMCGI